jgi:large subunit ribosomal protein L5
MSRLRDRYVKEVIPSLKKEYSYKNVMAVPKLEKIVVNMGVGEAIQNAKLLDAASDELSLITGQRPVITRAKKSIASFKLRKGMAIGCSVTLRGERMYEFFDRLVNVALPRVRDFRGLSTNDEARTLLRLLGLPFRN